MNKKVFTEKIIVATSQYMTVDYTRKLYNSISKEGIPFTFMVAFDGTPKAKRDSLEDIVDIGLNFKQEIHSIPEIWNCIFNLSKSTDAEFLLICDNDQELKHGSFTRMVSLMNKWDVISPVKIDKDVERFNSYCSNEEPVEVIGFNDSTWFLRLSKVKWNPEDRKYGPFGFEDVPFVYDLWRNGARFVVDPQAVTFHYCSQDTGNCFNPVDREKYSKEWDKKRDFFLATNGPDAQWFFDNVIMNAEGIKRFGYPVFIKKEIDK